MKFDYFKELRKYLKLPSEIENDAIKELWSHVQPNENNEDLVKSLGEPKKLAEKINESKQVTVGKLLRLPSTYILAVLIYFGGFIISQIVAFSLSLLQVSFGWSGDVVNAVIGVCAILIVITTCALVVIFNKSKKQAFVAIGVFIAISFILTLILALFIALSLSSLSMG